MIEVVWEFRVAKGRENEFERVYGSQGPWADLFRGAAEYAGTTLLRDHENTGRYLTIDRWASMASYERFRERFADEYAEIDHRCEPLTESERLIGTFDRV